LKITALVLGGITLIVVFFLVFRLSFKDKNLTVDHIYEERWAEQDALYIYIEDFEGESFVTDSTFLFEEQSSLHVKPENEYTTLVKIANEDLKINSATLVVTVDIYPGNYIEALLVSDISGGNTTDGWHAARTEKSIEKLNSWNKMTYQRNFYDLSEQNEINVYLWNQKKMDFRIDNISVRIYPLIK
jgi:hypothetical protein